MPFVIDKAMLSDAFQGNLKLAKIVAYVDGGTADQWEATALAIADQAKDIGADSIDVSIDRTDLGDIDAAPMYRHLATVQYSPDPGHSLWKGLEQTTVMRGDNIATKEQILRDNAFEAAVQKLTESGMDPDKADKKAGAMIAKKFHQPSNWKLHPGNLVEHHEDANMNVDTTAAKDSLVKVVECLKDRTTKELAPCNG